MAFKCAAHQAGHDRLGPVELHSGEIGSAGWLSCRCEPFTLQHTSSHWNSPVCVQLACVRVCVCVEPIFENACTAPSVHSDGVGCDGGAGLPVSLHANCNGRPVVSRIGLISVIVKINDKVINISSVFICPVVCLFLQRGSPSIEWGPTALRASLLCLLLPPSLSLII